MASANPFDLLGDDDQGDLSQLIAAQQLKLAAESKKAAAPVKSGAVKGDAPGKLPSKPLPPAQAVREARDAPCGRARGGGRGFGRGQGSGGSNGDYGNNENSYSSNGFSGGYRPAEDGEEKDAERRSYGAPRGGFRGGRRGGFGDGGDAEGERPRRVYERHSGTGRSNDFKREGSGRGNWGTPDDEITPEAGEVFVDKEKVASAENQQPGQEDAGDASKDVPVNEPEEKEPEDKEMTLEEYEKVLEEKRKALVSLKTTEGRKVVQDKDFETMQVLSSKKSDEEIFAKLGSDKEKRKEPAEKEEKVKKSVSINEFLKPAEGGRSGGRGRGRGRGPRGGFNGGGFNGGSYGSHTAPAPAIDDANQFPSLKAK